MISTAELITLAAIQAFLGFSSERRLFRFERTRLAAMFPYLPKQPGYNKWVRLASTQMRTLIYILVRETDLFYNDVFVVDSTPVESGRSRPTAKRSELAGFASYGYSASHSRYFWGLHLYLLCTPPGLLVVFALANAKIDEREVLRDLPKWNQSYCGLARRSSPTRATQEQKSRHS